MHSELINTMQHIARGTCTQRIIIIMVYNPYTMAVLMPIYSMNTCDQPQKGFSRACTGYNNRFQLLTTYPTMVCVGSVSVYGALILYNYMYVSNNYYYYYVSPDYRSLIWSRHHYVTWQNVLNHEPVHPHFIKRGQL